MTRPLFQADPGWLFLLAGLAVCAAGVLLPGEADRHEIAARLAGIRAEEAYTVERLDAHARFLDAVERGDPGVLRRLAAAQLNVMPAGDTPILLASASSETVEDWIDAAATYHPPDEDDHAVSRLEQLASGPRRLWIIGAGVLAVFIGLILRPSLSG